MEHHYKAIQKALERFAFKKGTLTAFKDCIHIMALRLALRTDELRREERKTELQLMAECYQGDDEKVMLDLINTFNAMFKDYYENFDDHLGKIYMSLVPKSANSQGQVFTPYHVAKLMAEMTFGSNEHDKPVKYYDPCCGGGVFSIAICDMLNDRKINYLQEAIIHAEDIDLTCVEMCYLQLTFFGASAIVEHKNTLTQEKWNEYRTGGYLIIKEIKGDY